MHTQALLMFESIYKIFVIFIPRSKAPTFSVRWMANSTVGFILSQFLGQWTLLWFNDGFNVGCLINKLVHIEPSREGPGKGVSRLFRHFLGFFFRRDPP